MKITVIIPTYNERGNIGLLIEALEKEFTLLDNGYLTGFTILVVDSNSPDGTGEVVRQAMTQYANVRLLAGEKRGLGADTARGVRYAMEKLGAGVVVTMDGDLSHDPRDVKRLLAEIEGGADYVIGSRYIPGGSIPTDWGLKRKFLSFFGNLVARTLGVWEVHDQTPAFRAIRVGGVLDKINLDSLPKGYAFQMALICAAHDVGAKFAEVPVQFKDRTRGKSKLPKGYIIEALGFLVKYRLKKLKVKSEERKAAT